MPIASTGIASLGKDRPYAAGKASCHPSQSDQNLADRQPDQAHPGLSSKLDKRFKELRSGILVRIVLDVEKGAIYYYKLSREGFLIGVTLEQSEVDPTDRKLSELANEILVYLGGRPDDDFYRK